MVVETKKQEASKLCKEKKFNSEDYKNFFIAA